MEESAPFDSGQVGNVGDTEPAFTYACPRCGTPICLHEAPPGGLVQCPACGAQFFAAAGEDAEDEAEADRRARQDSEAKLNRGAEEKVDFETEFNENRIKQFKVLRRSMIRIRSYFVVGAAGCLGLAAELLYLARQSQLKIRAQAGGQPVGRTAYAWPLALVFCAVACCLGCVYFIRRVRQADRELAVPLQADPLTPPDFSALIVGSQNERCSENVAGGPEGGAAGEARPED
jgi:uncharacterized Zn finger protein (UPF0148 family)